MRMDYSITTTKDMTPAIIPYPIIKTLSSLDNIYEARLFGWCIAKAQAAAKHYDTNLGHINIQFGLSAARVTFPARYLLQPGEKNYAHISKAFSLARKTIDTKHGQLNIIAFPELIKRGGELWFTFLLHQQLWYALLDFTAGYRIADLEVYMRFRSTYSVIFYLLISQQREDYTFSLDYLKQLTGTSGLPAYNRGNNFIAKVVDVAKRELDRDAPWTFDYVTERNGRALGRCVIRPHANATYVAHDETPRERLLEMQRVVIDERVRDYLQYNIGMLTDEMEVAERWLPRTMEPDRLICWLADVKETARRNNVSNLKGYVIGALKRQFGR